MATSRERHGSDAAASTTGPAAPTVTIPTNSVTPYLRSRFTVLDGCLLVSEPRTLLGLVPIGRRSWTADLADVRDLRTAWALRPERLAALVALVLLARSGPRPLAAVLVALALWLVPLSLIAVLRVEPVHGRVRRFPICLFYRFDIGLVAAIARAEAGP